MRNVRITHKPEITIIYNEPSHWSGLKSLYSIETARFKLIWYIDGYVNIYYKNTDPFCPKNETIKYLLPDMNVFKDGRVYKAFKVNNFVEKIKKVRLFI